MAKRKKTKVAARRIWRINPKTRVKESVRVYRRSKEKRYIYGTEEYEA